MPKSLEQLVLNHNQITDAGCSTLSSALDGGALPALMWDYELEGNPASEYAQEAVWMTWVRTRGSDE